MAVAPQYFSFVTHTSAVGVCLVIGFFLAISALLFGGPLLLLLELRLLLCPSTLEVCASMMPITGRKCTTLVLPPGLSHFASTKGWGVAYSSQRECEVLRAYRSIDKASARLKALSKYTRKPTRRRLEDKISARRVFVEDHLDRIVGIMF